MAERPGPPDDAVHHVTAAIENLTLAMKRIDELQNKDKPLNIPVPLTEEFYEALKVKLDKGRNLQKQEYKSPLDLVNILNFNEEAVQVVVKLFEKQNEIQWHTPTRKPDSFSFYAFCKSVKYASRKKVMTYSTRKAHVISKLYQKQAELRDIQELTHEQLCPPIYVRHTDGRWRKFTHGIENLEGGEPIENGIDWITKDGLREYIARSSKEYNQDAVDNKEFLGRTRGEQLYWAVFEEDDYDLYRDQDDDIPFKTQVYVGITTKGINQRWLGSGTSHCSKMKTSRDIICDTRTDKRNDLYKVMLVDLRFLLHKACNPRGSKSGLFIMETGGSTLNVAEGRNIEGQSSDGTGYILDIKWSPKNMNYGLNGIGSTALE